MKTPLSLIAISSAFQGTTEDAIRRNHVELFAALDEVFRVNIITEDRFDSLRPTAFTPSHSCPLTLIFIASGGTEGKLVQLYDRLPKPLILLTDGKANSLAASLEISNWIRNQGDTCRILHNDPEELVSAIQDLTLRSIMQGKRIGILGEPSDWLVASNVDYTAASERWGVKFVPVSLTRVEDYFSEAAATDDEVDAFISGGKKMMETNRDEVVKAFRLYHAIRRIADEERLQALTVRCFDLITSCHTTGCLALALLNDEGIIAGCEGDVPAVFTMLLCKQLTGADAFMANPARIRDKELLLAHCTIGLRQTEKYIIRSHFESGTGVAIQGLLREHQPVTVVKVGGTDLSRIAFAQAILAENQNDPKKCRTQILLRTTNTDLSHYLLHHSIGNHHILLQGDHTIIFRHLCNALKLKNEVTSAYTFYSDIS